MAVLTCKDGDLVSYYFFRDIKSRWDILQISNKITVAMEDAHTTILKLGDTDLSFFGVYDGHGGRLLMLVRKQEINPYNLRCRFFYSSLYWSNII